MPPPTLLDQPAPITPEEWRNFSQAVFDGLHGKWLKVTAATQASVTQVFYMNL